MKHYYLLLLFFAITAMISCKKDTDPRFSARGFWKGNVFVYVCALMNRENGTMRMYVKIPGAAGTDTAHAAYMYNGRYWVDGNVYRAMCSLGGTDSLFIESSSVSPGHMSGKMFDGGLTGEFLPYEFQRVQ